VEGERVNPDLIRAQIETMQIEKLGYLAGSLSATLGLRRTSLAVDVVNGVPDAAVDLREYFIRFVCILGTVVTDTQCDLAIEVLNRSIPTPGEHRV